MCEDFLFVFLFFFFSLSSSMEAIMQILYCCRTWRPKQGAFIQSLCFWALRRPNSYHVVFWNAFSHNNPASWCIRLCCLLSYDVIQRETVAVVSGERHQDTETQLLQASSHLRTVNVYKGKIQWRWEMKMLSPRGGPGFTPETIQLRGTGNGSVCRSAIPDVE